MHKRLTVMVSRVLLYKVTFPLAFPVCIANVLNNHYFFLPSSSDIIFLLKYLLYFHYRRKSVVRILSVFKYLKICLLNLTKIMSSISNRMSLKIKAKTNQSFGLLIH